jgi:hypothetical protein
MSKSSTAALLAVAGLFVAGVALPSAQAADLGGDCCADLEERVAELEATTARKGNRRVSLTVSGQVTKSLMWANDGADTGFFPGVDGSFATSGFALSGSAKINPNVSAGFEIAIDINSEGRSHQISQGDDEGMGTAVVLGSAGFGLAGDAAISLSRANWWLEHKQFGRLTVGRINSALAGAASVDLGGMGVAASGGGVGANGGMGYIARTTAGPLAFSNGAGQLYNVGFNASVAQAGNLLAAGGNTLAATYGNFMGSLDVGFASLSRKEGVRYDSPNLFGFTFSASMDEGNIGERNPWDVALRYAGEFSGFRIAAAAAYRNELDCEATVCAGDASLAAGANNVLGGLIGFGGGGASGATFTQVTNPDQRTVDADRRKTSLSGSVLHVPSGLFLSGAYVINDYHGTNGLDCDNGSATCATGNRPDTKLLWLAGGISKNWTGLGNTTLFGQWARTDDPLTGVKNSFSAASGTFNYGLGMVDSKVTDSEGRMWGVGVVQNIDAAAMELYVSYVRVSAEAKSTGGGDCAAGQAGTSCASLLFGLDGPNNNTYSIEDMWSVMAGARIRF